MSIANALEDVRQDTLSAWDRLDMAWNSLNGQLEQHGELVQLPMKEIEAAMNHLETVGDYFEERRKAR